MKSEKIPHGEGVRLAKLIVRRLGLKFVPPDQVTVRTRYIQMAGIPLGSLRRGEPLLKDVDILITDTITPESVHQKIPEAEGIIGGSKNIYFVLNKRKINLFVSTDKNTFGAALLHHTGPAFYNMRLRNVARTKGMQLSQHGLLNEKGKLLAGKTESEVQRAMGVKERHPSIRGEGGERWMKRPGTKRLCVFDFDGTLIHTPTPEEGVDLWERKTKTTWPHRGWWGEEDSLDDEIFTISPNEKVASEFKKRMASPEDHVVILTGRPPKLAREVTRILRKFHLIPHDIYYTRSGTALAYKKRLIPKLIEKMSGLEEVEIWEDRSEHAREFSSLSEHLRVSLRVNLVN